MGVSPPWERLGATTSETRKAKCLESQIEQAPTPPQFSLPFLPGPSTAAVQDEEAGRTLARAWETTLVWSLDPLIPNVKLEEAGAGAEGAKGRVKLGKVLGRAAASEAAKHRNSHIQGDSPISFKPSSDRRRGVRVGPRTVKLEGTMDVVAHRFSNLAVLWIHLGSFKNCGCLRPTL